METEVKILKVLIPTENPVTIRELAKLVGANYSIVHKAVKRLAKKKLLLEKKAGSSILVGFSGKFSKDVFLAEEERREEVLRDKNIAVSLDEIKRKLKTKLFVLLLFGSYSKGEHRNGSDIDLMFIFPDDVEEKKADDAISGILPPIHALAFGETDFKNMLKSHEPNVIKEAVKTRIILYGIEQYYELTA